MNKIPFYKNFFRDFLAESIFFHLDSSPKSYS